MFSLFFAAVLASAPADAAPIRLAASATTQTPAPAPATTPPINDLIRKMSAELQAEDAEAALATVTAIQAHPDFAGLPAQRRRGAIILLGALNAQLGHYEAALPWLVQATAWSDVPTGIWFTRIEVEARLKDRTAAARTLTTLIQAHPEVLPDLSKDFTLQMARSSEIAPDAAFDLRLALYEAGWREDDASYVWVDLIDDLLTRDRIADAVPVVALVTYPTARLQLHALKRYDALMARAGATDFDIDQVFAQDLEADRVAAADASADKTFEKRSAYATALVIHGRDAEALAAADAALALPDTKSDEEAAGSRTWIMDTRARALMALGRRDEALAQLQSAAARSEHGDDNVSQQINLGWLYLRLGRNADALAAVKTITRDGASAFGVMQAVQVRGCAAHLLNNASVEAPAYAYLAEHWKDAPGAWRDALACKGDVDAVAGLLLQQLEDPEQADGAVSDMHQWKPAAGMTDFDLSLDRTLKAAMARPEVVAARDRVARAYTVPVIGDMF